MGWTMSEMPDYVRKRLPVVFSREKCSAPHPTPEQLEEMLDDVEWYWFDWIDENNTPHRVRRYDCPSCHGSGVVAEDADDTVDEEWRRAVGSPEPIPADSPILTMEQYVVGMSGPGEPTRRVAGEAVRRKIFPGAYR
jgi:hypothetical protein